MRDFLEKVTWGGSQVANPHQAIPKALMLATVLIMLTYLVPVLVTTALDPDWEAYKDGHYTEVAHELPACAYSMLGGAGCY